MERERIEALLEKYWQGETTLEEERALKKYLSGARVPEDMKKEAAFFNYLNTQLSKQAPSDEEILAALDDDNTSGSSGIVVSLWLKNISKVAAVIFIVAAAIFFVREDFQTKKQEMDPLVVGTIEDPQKAFEETKKALMLVSQQFKKGKKHAQKLGAFDDATEKVQELEREL